MLSKINGALEPGDPVLVMAGMDKRPYREPDEDERHWMRRIEQEKIDGMVNGTDKGHYHLIMYVS